MTSPGKIIIPLIVTAQFLCTSLWFAGNAVVNEIKTAFHLTDHATGLLTSSVQLGFISGTLLFAVLTIADRFSPSRVFMICALAGALANLGLYLVATDLGTLLTFRFITGVCLAGIYPVGMKIAADYHQKGLGKALGWLVGALVLGTAFPHLLKALTQGVSWYVVIFITTGCAVAGGLMIGGFVPDGPYRKKVTQPDFRAFFSVFKKPDFRAAAFGYFGHMWELYAFWAFVPALLVSYLQAHPRTEYPVSLTSFFIIAAGSAGCAIGGYFAERFGSDKVAFATLATSGLCCLLSPWFTDLPLILFLFILLVWGTSVVTDSPQFSTLVATTAPSEAKGTALTIVNSIGFFITIFSIQLLDFLVNSAYAPYAYLALALGPLFGLRSLLPLFKKQQKVISTR